MKYDFIEIGTSDFDTEIQNCDDDKIGLSIEPLIHYLDNLPNKKNVTKVNAAVSNYNGFVDIYYLNEEIIKKFDLPDYVKGQNSIGNPHPEILHWFVRGLTNEDISKKNVPVINFETIIKKYNVESLELLKVDTEGHDCIIMEDYLGYVFNNHNLLAKKIIFESNILSNQASVNSIINKCVSLGYTIVKTGENTILTKV